MKLARLGYDSEKRLVELRLWPADTLEQARSFYARPEAVDRVLELQSEGWSVSPNFHFGFVASGYCWTSTTMRVAEYLHYWLERIVDTVQIERRDWDDQYWRDLVNEKIAAFEDVRVSTAISQTPPVFQRLPRPGVRCAFGWHLDEAERLDARDN